MKKITIKDIGKVMYWTDHIKMSRGEEGEAYYDQSNTALEGYHNRIIGITKCRKTKNYIIAVALSQERKNQNKSARSGRGVVNTRLRKAISLEGSIGPEDKGVTSVPKEYLDFLYKDYATFNNLYGPADPTMLDMALMGLKKNG